MNITKSYYEYLSGINKNNIQYQFKCEKFSPLYKCNRLQLQINEVENNISKLSSMSRKSSSFNNSHFKISNATVNIKKSLIEIESELEELKTKELKKSSTIINRFSKLLIENSVEILSRHISDLTLKFQKLLQQQAEKIKKIEKRKKNISHSANKKNNINKAFNEYATDFTNNNNYNEDDILLEVGDQQITQNKESEYYKSRLNDVQAIEKTMGEISGMMNRLSQMTYEQNFMIDNISKNTDVALDHIEKGEKEVKKLLERAKSNKWLFIKIFFIVLCISIFYIIFIV
jgi:syntaxin 5